MTHPFLQLDVFAPGQGGVGGAAQPLITGTLTL